jgi:hypothetical protein
LNQYNQGNNEWDVGAVVFPKAFAYGFSDGGGAEAAKKARNRRMDVQKF